MLALLQKPKTYTAVVVAIDRDRDSLKNLMQDLRRRISAAPCSNQSLASLLRSLVLHLEVHFEAERQAGGALDVLLAAAPVHSAEIEQLVRDHHQLLLQANDLANRFHQGPWSHEHCGELERRFEQLQADFNDHEMREALLLRKLEQPPKPIAVSKPHATNPRTECAL